MSETINGNELLRLRNEIKVLYTYISSRDEFNFNVVKVMVQEIQNIVKGLTTTEIKVSYDKDIIDYLKKVSKEYRPIKLEVLENDKRNDTAR